jgi:CHAT domain-containing protein
LELRGRAVVGGEGIAILADPVFQADDPRVRRAGNAERTDQLALLDPELQRGAQRVGISEFPRLRGSLEEANAIRAAAGDIDVLTLQGTDANRDTVLSGGLNRYEILHFATHGILDDEEPALSGLVLSGFSADGRGLNRFLRSQDSAGLDLQARLVVLCGCETGLGRLVHGEGLLGLSRAFFYAGANQVVSTLWQVPDLATAALMGHFYRALLQDNIPAPAALRQAQLALQQSSRWRHPYYWASFIVQGDWN